MSASVRTLTIFHIDMISHSRPSVNRKARIVDAIQDSRAAHAVSVATHLKGWKAAHCVRGSTGGYNNPSIRLVNENNNSYGSDVKASAYSGSTTTAIAPRFPGVRLPKCCSSPSARAPRSVPNERIVSGKTSGCCRCKNMSSFHRLRSGFDDLPSVPRASEIPRVRNSFQGCGGCPKYACVRGQYTTVKFRCAARNSASSFPR